MLNLGKGACIKRAGVAGQKRNRSAEIQKCSAADHSKKPKNPFRGPCSNISQSTPSDTALAPSEKGEESKAKKPEKIGYR